MAWTDEERLVVAERFAERRIFVSITAFRDRDLAQTVRSALDSASAPARLRFGICLHVDDAMAASWADFQDDPRVAVVRVPFRERRGGGWARARANEFYDLERYVLQIDAPMRFVEGWDRRMIEMLESTDSERPIITDHPLAVTRAEDGVETLSEPMPSVDRRSRPRRVAGGHLFAHGRFVLDVPTDPEISAEAQDLTLSLRAYTHGYDLFWPSESLVTWYGHPTSERPHADVDQAGPRAASRRKVDRLIRNDDRGMGRHGLGCLRTIAAHEHLAGRPVGSEVDPPVNPSTAMSGRPRPEPACPDPDLGPMTAKRLGSGPRHLGPIDFVQTIGPFNSGTSLMFLYLNAFVRVPTSYHGNFWKHSLPPAWEWFEGCRWPRSRAGPSDEMLGSSLFIAMVRNPYFWIVSCSLAGYELDFVDARRGGASARLHSRVRLRGREFADMASLWNAYYSAYDAYLGPHDVRYLRLEDLVSDPGSVMADLQSLLPIELGTSPHETIESIRTEPGKRHHVHPGPVGDDADRLYRVANVRAMLEPADLQRINRSLDRDLMARFGYPIVSAE